MSKKVKRGTRIKVNETGKSATVKALLPTWASTTGDLDKATQTIFFIAEYDDKSLVALYEDEFEIIDQ